MQNFALFVNTCDKFEDCWRPFFKLFSIYWPDFQGKIYLNTEYKTFEYQGLDIVSVQNSIETKDAHLITWSECLKRALDSIDNDYILYMQEDYFLKSPVQNTIVQEFYTMMKLHPIDCIHLTDQGAKAERPSLDFEKLWKVPQKDKDRVSCQAALWKKDVLVQYIRTYESAWNFEWWGSKRAAILKHEFYTVDRSWIKLNQFEIIPYVFTGVIGGKWLDEVVPLFDKYGIEMDYTRRGFFKPIPPLSLKAKVIRKLKKLPLEIRCSLDLLKLRFTNN